MNDTVYPHINPNDYNNSLAITDFCMWVLSSFENVNDVVDALNHVNIWGNKVPVLNLLMKLHIPIHDAMGNNLVIEFINGKTVLYNNVLGVLTNEPPLNYHLTNIGSFNSLNPISPDPIIINGLTINPIPGTGLDAMSGGWSPTARFNRIATLIRFIKGINTAQDAVMAASWILNSVFVPNGIEIGTFAGRKVTVTTRWGTIKDVTNMKFYFRGDDSVLRYVNLNKIDFSKGSYHKPYLVRQPPFTMDITSQL
jgi:choloylglycine hydrolase